MAVIQEQEITQLGFLIYEWTEITDLIDNSKRINQGTLGGTTSAFTVSIDKVTLTQEL